MVGLGFLFPGLVVSNILLEMTFLDQEFNLILQLGALFCCVSNVLVVGAIFIFVYVWHIPYRVGVTHIGLIGYGIHDLFFANC